MIHVKDPSQCCGCTACASICPNDAITMKPDDLGFVYPSVDIRKCSDCGLCEQVCSFNDQYDTSLNISIPHAYAVRHKDMKEVESSRSGAAFIAISDKILLNGGVVYGVGYTDHFRVVHKRAVSREERDEFKGSKYVQSDLTGVFRQVKNDLRNGQTVLFSGTPCQTAGLNAYVGRRLRDKLYLLDIVCHGVPSPYFWRDYINYLEKKQKDRISWVNFRDKQVFGWAAHHETFRFEKGRNKVSFRYVFYHDYMLRRSCGYCHFSNIKRPSDITIGDFWGWERILPNMNSDDKGISLVLLNTEKGQNLFNDIKKDVNFVALDLKDCLQPNLQHPSEIPPQRESIEHDYIKHGFTYVAKKYGDMGYRYHVQTFKRKLNTAIKLLFE